MKITYNWLKDFVDFELSPEELSHQLTMLGLEVEGIQSLGNGMDDVVVAVVEAKEQHPNADKLSLCKVNDGKEILSIVCGARNFSVGDKVALARIGAVLPGDFRIKRSKIRGEESFGMLCSEKELGLADESEGIMILAGDLPLGVSLFEAIGLKDTVFEIGLTPNRADCLSVIGIAREIAAKLGKKVKYPGHDIKEGENQVNEFTSVKIDDPELCPRYAARYIAGCKIGPSPGWLVNRLNAVGMRSINNVVDITNYVLMEYGHPLHAFDHDLLSEGRIVVRRAGEGEIFRTLDGQERILKDSDLTIRDAKEAVALAGIMGGENSEVGINTCNILLESAYFNPTAIRRTSKRLGLHTEASHRFERGADVDILLKALNRAASLMVEIAGGCAARGVIDVYPESVEPVRIKFREERAKQVLGITFSTEEILKCFTDLEFVCTIDEPGVMNVTVPSFRVDIDREIDLIEELARMTGYEGMPATMPKVSIFSDRPTAHQRLERKVKDLLVAHGLSEVINYSFISPASYEKILLDSDDYRRNSVKLMNPLTEEQAVMRTTMLPGLLETAARNISFRNLNLQIFEMRRIYISAKETDLPEEPLYISGFMTGKRHTEGWNQSKEDVDFFDLKGLVENIIKELRIEGVTFNNTHIDNYYHPGKACNICLEGDVIGSLGEIHPTVEENYSLETPGYYFEINFEKLVAASSEKIAAISPSRFPDTFRDIAMLVKEETAASTVLETITNTKLRELDGVELFDLYKGTNVPHGEKSLAVRVRYRSYEKTLTDDEISAMHNKVIDNLVKKLDVSIR
jgi:phenylalanyl-tRNA synthetase beta chain